MLEHKKYFSNETLIRLLLKILKFGPDDVVYVRYFLIT